MFHNSTTCKKCNSENTQSFQMVYETGTSSGQVRFMTYDGDGLGVGGGRTSSQTVLAQKVRPPENPGWAGSELAVTLLLPLIILLFFFWMEMILIALLLAVGATVGVWFLIEKSHEKPKSVYHLQQARWLRSWICLKCGAIWEFKKSSKSVEMEKASV